MQPVYLDFNATAPLLPEVAEAMAVADAAGYANPASQHAAGRRAHAALEDCREEIAQLLGATLTGRHADRLIFTSGGTEANNLALFGITAAAPVSAVAISAIEHPSVTAAAKQLAARGWRVVELPVDRSGVTNVSAWERLLKESSPQRAESLPLSLVSVMLANNETGAIQPIVELATLCREANVPLHTDATQAVGKVPVSFRKLGVSAMTVTAHKLHGPRGIGALVLRHDLALAPQLHGAMQQLGMRAGTESVTLPIGFLAALRAWKTDADRTARLTRLRDRLEAGLKAALPSCVVNAASAPRLPHTSNVAFVGHDRQALLIALDMAGVQCSTGSACASGSSEPSPTLLAMGLTREVVAGSLRFSVGATTTEKEIDEAVYRISSVMLTQGSKHSDTFAPLAPGIPGESGRG